VEKETIGIERRRGNNQSKSNSRENIEIGSKARSRSSSRDKNKKVVDEKRKDSNRSHRSSLSHRGSKEVENVSQRLHAELHETNAENEKSEPVVKSLSTIDSESSKKEESSQKSTKQLRKIKEEKEKRESEVVKNETLDLNAIKLNAKEEEEIEVHSSSLSSVSVTSSEDEVEKNGDVAMDDAERSGMEVEEVDSAEVKLNSSSSPTSGSSNYASTRNVLAMAAAAAAAGGSDEYTHFTSDSKNNKSNNCALSGAHSSDHYMSSSKIGSGHSSDTYDKAKEVAEQYMRVESSSSTYQDAGVVRREHDLRTDSGNTSTQNDSSDGGEYARIDSSGITEEDDVQYDHASAIREGRVRKRANTILMGDDIYADVVTSSSGGDPTAHSNPYGNAPESVISNNSAQRMLGLREEEQGQQYFTASALIRERSASKSYSNVMTEPSEGEYTVMPEEIDETKEYKGKYKEGKQDNRERAMSIVN